MNRILLPLFFLATAPLTLTGQVLLPSIGIGSLPADSTSICPIPWYLGSFYSSGLQPGDTAADFTLYDYSGNAFNLGNALSQGKPVLLVSGSYTCPVFRNKISSINNVINTYGSQVTVAVIYCVEAHPTDTSPYFGYVNITSANQSAGILYQQPATYGQRKQVVSDLQNNTALQAPVYIDGPCNNWWLYYGPAPNNAYLIDTSGIVFSKHGWYDSYPDNIICDIDSLLGLPGNCNPPNYNGSFILNMTSSDTAFGQPGATLAVDAELINTSATGTVLVKLGRLQNNMAPGWASSMCASVCYSTSTDTVTIAIAPLDTQVFHFYFYTDTVPNNANAVVGFRNQNNFSNSYMKTFYGFTSMAGTNELYGAPGTISIYPVPASDQLTVRADFDIARIEIADLTGKILLRTPDTQADIGPLAEGYYLLRVYDAEGKCVPARFLKLD